MNAGDRRVRRRLGPRPLAPGRARQSWVSASMRWRSSRSSSGNGAITLIEEGRVAGALEALRRMETPMALVVRDDSLIEVPLEIRAISSHSRRAIASRRISDSRVRSPSRSTSRPARRTGACFVQRCRARTDDGRSA